MAYGGTDGAGVLGAAVVVSSSGGAVVGAGVVVPGSGAAVVVDIRYDTPIK